MVSWGIFHTSFMQSILSFIPIVSIRKAIDVPQEDHESSSSPASVEPWKEEVDRWRQLADKTAAERDQLRHEAGQLHLEMQRVVLDLEQARVEAEEAWRDEEAKLVREKEETERKAREEIARAQEEFERQRAEEAKKAEEAVRATTEQYERAQAESARQAEERLQQTQKELSAIAADLEQTEREHQRLQAALEARGLELENLQRIVGVDKMNEADVLVLLRGLNEDIARTAKSVRDLFRLDRNTRASGKASMEAASAIEGWVGPVLPGLLSTQYRGNTVLLQAAMQALAVAFTSWISTSYSFMHEYDQILDETYKYVMNAESQVVLGRWRSLTHRYAKQSMPNLVDELSKMFISDVRNLLIVAGSSTMQTDNLLGRVKDNLRSIVTSAIKLRAAIGEDIISCDFETVLIQPGDTWDPTNMEDAYDVAAKGGKGGDASAKKVVLCAAGLGLRCCKKVTTEGDAGAQWEVAMLQKPPVVLQDALN